MIGRPFVFLPRFELLSSGEGVLGVTVVVVVKGVVVTGVVEGRALGDGRFHE